jgi:hypothetical protein
MPVQRQKRTAKTIRGFAATKGPRDVVRQAAADLRHGLVDTDLRGRSSRKKKWSAGVMRRSNALDLEKGVFTRRTPRAVALSLKRSAERSRRRKSTPFRSAMSMLSFEINRAGRNLPRARRAVLEQAKDELRKLYGRAPARPARRARAARAS